MVPFQHLIQTRPHFLCGRFFLRKESFLAGVDKHMEEAMPSPHALKKQTEIAELFVASLREGVRPWQKPWSARSCHGTVVRPLRHNGVPYQGINVIILGFLGASLGCTSPYWMTFKQGKALDAHLRKGSKGLPAFFVDSFVPSSEREAVSRGDKSAEDATHVFYTKSYTVFNADMFSDLPPGYTETVSLQSSSARDTRAEEFFRSIPCELQHSGNRAFLHVSQDFIRLPAFESFHNPLTYYATLAHEMLHWSFQPHRLGRDFLSGMTQEDAYAFEELVVEIGATILCMDLGLTPVIPEDNASYVGNWLKRLSNDPSLIFKAASIAQRGVSYLVQLSGHSSVANAA